jgi:zinc transport system substrate-binding protein
MRPFLTALPVAVASFALSSLAAAAAPNVVATIKPIHSLVAAVMGDIGSPALTVKGNSSPHTYSLKPSDAQALESADVVFWTGHGMEVFLEDSIAMLAPTATLVELSEISGLELLPVREGGVFEAHDDEEGHEPEEQEHDGEHEDEHEHEHEHEHGEADLHFWLDPANASIMLAAIAETLATLDPEHASQYKANADTEAERLAALTAELEAELAPVKDRPFVVFHDAYQYFERRFGLTVAGSITVTPEIMPGAQRVSELQDKLRSLGAACVFAEPQFQPAIATAIAEGTGASVGTLDPEGGGLTEGPGLYEELLRGLAGEIVRCLSASD